MVNTPPNIGILALQGDVREHRRVLEQLGAITTLVRDATDLTQLDGLVLPGGESSVIDKLTRIFGLREPLRQAIRRGLPVFGTCAGMILLADRLTDAISGQLTLGGLDITVARNAFGAQRESFETELTVPSLGGAPLHAAFIRAPLVTQYGAGVEVLARLPDTSIVAVRSGTLLATSFHPEITDDTRFHHLFLDEVNARRAHGPARSPA